MTITRPFFEVKQGKNRLYYWRLESRNGRTILRSVRGYKSKQNCHKAIANVIKYGTIKSHYEVDTPNIDGNGNYYILYGRRLGNKVYGQYENAVKLAISGNGKLYQSVNYQIANMGANKGIDSCISCLQTITNRIENGLPYIVDIVPDNRRTKK